MKIKNKNLDLSTGVVMGILNVNDNSFYDGGKYRNNSEIIKQVEKMISEGASIIDIGAQSSKPGSEPIPEKEELNKLSNTIYLIKKYFPEIIISIDTYRSNIAEVSINNGADMINDISAGNLDKNMFNIIAKYNIPYIMMHMQGIPKNMQEKPRYNNIIEEIISFFKFKLDQLERLGANKIIIDPGIGFGKTMEHNYHIIKNLRKFLDLKKPILMGVSRKSLISKPLNIHPNDSLNGTTIINTLCLKNGASILRVHDVKEAIECIKIINLVKK